jgi:hypothetical protein
LASIDLSKLREAVSGPGIDQRDWVCIGRVDDDSNAVVWDDKLGWLCDVTSISSHNAGERLPLPCRVSSLFQGSGIGEHRPQRPNGIVVVVFPTGDPNEESVIIGQLHNFEDSEAPTEVNGTTIDESFALKTHFTVAPEEDLDQEWKNVRITASEKMVFGTEDADQKCVRGDDLSDTLDDLIDAIGDFAQALATATPAAPNAALTVADVAAAYVNLEISLQQAKQSKENWLSSRITVD